MNPKIQLRLGLVCLFLAVTVIVASAPAAEIAASGLSFPFFDEAGKLSHKVVAKTGSMVGSTQQLRDVEVEYYEAGDPKRITQRVVTSEATWDSRTEVLTGSGAIRVETEENTLTGEGFRFELGRSQLNVHREFRMTNPEVELTSDRAVVDLVLERHDNDVKLRDVKRSEAIGNLRLKIQPTAKKKYDFDEAFSERAIYLGETHVIHIPQETHFRKNGRPSGTTNHFTMTLDPKSRPARQLNRD